MLPIKNRIELVVKSLGRGPFRSKVNCDPGAVACAAGAVRRRAAGETVSFACLDSPASEIVTATANGSHVVALISPAKGHYPDFAGMPQLEITGRKSPDLRRLRRRRRGLASRCADRRRWRRGGPADPDVRADRVRLGRLQLGDVSGEPVDALAHGSKTARYGCELVGRAAPAAAGCPVPHGRALRRHP